MRSVFRWIRRVLAERDLRRRFPAAVVYSGASADRESDLGRNAVLFQDAALCRSSLGAFSYVQSGTTINNADVGPFCAIAGSVVVGLAAHPTSMVSMSPVFYDNTQPLPEFLVDSQLYKGTMPRTTIGADVWIGYGALVKAGVTIGVGAVVGAGAVVTKDVRPYMIVAGNPCREIRSRFPVALCQRLIETRWWEQDERMLKSLAKHFASPEEFCEQLERMQERISVRPTE